MAAAFEVIDAMALCGVENTIQFNGATAAERIAMEMFDDDHQSVMDKSYTDLQDDLKAFSSLTVANGQIRLTPWHYEKHPRIYSMGEGYYQSW